MIFVLINGIELKIPVLVKIRTYDVCQSYVKEVKSTKHIDNRDIFTFSIKLFIYVILNPGY